MKDRVPDVMRGRSGAGPTASEALAIARGREFVRMKHRALHDLGIRICGKPIFVEVIEEDHEFALEEVRGALRLMTQEFIAGEMQP